MMEILEPDMHLVVKEGGIVIHKDQDAIAEKIRYWANTKKGEFWGKPWKGNELHKYQFRNPIKLIFSLLEMEIAEDLPTQVPIKILNITCKAPTRADKRTYLQIVYQSLLKDGIGFFAEDIGKAA
jgi:hypothetical protein